jgi:parallel beta-helix repeat protein
VVPSDLKPINYLMMKHKRFGLYNLIIILFMMNFNLYSQVNGLVNVKYSEQLLTVGGASADIPGYTSEAIQIAIDALKSRGGGTVKLNPGVYNIITPVRLASKTILSGSGEETILRKTDGFRTNFIIDADWGMLKATVKDVSGFRKGMGIQLFDDSNKDGWDVTTAVITDITDNVIYFNNNTVNDYQASLNGIVSNACSVVEGTEVENATVKNLVIEGNKSQNDYINGCRGGGLYLFKSTNCLVENVKVNNFNGDSFSWQVTENITVRNCEALNGEGLGFHPGTGSDHTVIEGCKSHNNKLDGIFLCWRVQNGVFKNNTVYSNGRYGISIGHKDTDNSFENNRIYENGLHGIYLRDENEQNAGHRNIFINNTIENNGTSRESYGFYIDGETHDLNITGNIIRSGGSGNQTGSIYIGKKASLIKISNNTVSGSKQTVFEK